MTAHGPVDRTDIDAELVRVLGDADTRGVDVAREAVEEPADRWYGQVVGATYAALADSPADDTVVAAAATVELLRGYIRIRSQLLTQLSDERPHSLTADPEIVLLAGDYLYTTAFSTLGSNPHPRCGENVAALSSAFETITDAFSRSTSDTAPSDDQVLAFLDRTLGSLGATATRLGASLAADDSVPRADVATLGRALGTAHGAQRLRTADPGSAAVVSPAMDESALREYAETQREKAMDALDALPGSVGVATLHPLVAEDTARTDEDDR
ncbi:polyprenyl synthetase [Halarchaeum sp. P4]|uniref:polyprenyl synthetase n=1 Tax=Halarchaeum sp. P4 TaxID=3421639 RepID=UPI003EBBCC60